MSHFGVFVMLQGGIKLCFSLCALCKFLCVLCGKKRSLTAKDVKIHAKNTKNKTTFYWRGAVYVIHHAVCYSVFDENAILYANKNQKSMKTYLTLLIHVAYF